MILFRCCTFGQLINIINIKTTLYKEEKADLMLAATTDFSEIIEGLENTGIFENIILSEDNTEDNKRYSCSTIEEKIGYLKKPSSFIKYVELPNVYTDFFSYSMVLYSQMIYYYLLECGMKPKIHLYEEGMYNYVEDPYERAELNNLSHKCYGKSAFMENVVEQLLYEPELYSATKPSWELNKIPKIDYKNESVKALYNSIMKYSELPKEKYIFLEEAYVWDRIDARDIENLNELAEIVGKDNIIVKMHPRNPINRFAPLGYKVIENSKTPWEMTMLNCDLSDKVLVTISSNASITAKIIFDMPMTTIHLFKTVCFGRNNAQKKKPYVKFLEKLIAYCNREQLSFFVPNSKEELKEMIKYIEGKQRNGLSK